MALGLSQTDFAKQAGIPVPRLSSIERGHQSIYIERLLALAKALNVSADYLIGLSDDPTPPKKRPRPRKATPVG
jgi:transcriptional regulator with XRE-family HTH domain